MRTISLVLALMSLSACSDSAHQERTRAAQYEIEHQLKDRNERLEIDNIGKCEGILRLKPNDKHCRDIICSAKPRFQAEYGIDFDTNLRADGIQLTCPAGGKQP